MTPAGRVVAVMPSLPPRPLITSVSFAPSALVMLTRADRPSTETERAGAEHVDDVVAVGAVDDHRVGRRVAGGAADRAGEIDVDLRHVGAGEVVDRDGVGAAERVEVDRLDVVEIHDDVAEVAGEQHAPAVRRDRRRSRCRRCR